MQIQSITVGNSFRKKFGKENNLYFSTLPAWIITRMSYKLVLKLVA